MKVEHDQQGQTHLQLKTSRYSGPGTYEVDIVYGGNASAGKRYHKRSPMRIKECICASLNNRLDVIKITYSISNWQAPKL